MIQKEKCMYKAKTLKEMGKRQKEIAELLNVSERTVRNYLNPNKNNIQKKKRPGLLDNYKSYIKEALDVDSNKNRMILFDEIKAQGYTGKLTILREFAKKVTDQITKEAVIRFETNPGKQAQVDWKEFGKQTVNGQTRKLYAFMMVLGYSRYPFVCFTTDMKSSTLLECHVLAFNFFGGVPKEVLYDNMKTAFICDNEGIYYPNKNLKEFADYYGFTPKRCRIRRPQTKGKVERAIDYLGNNFWPRVDKTNICLDEINENVLNWIDKIRHKTINGLNESRAQRFDAEKPCLNPLPQEPFDTSEVVPAIVNRESMVSFEANKYSVPPQFIGKTLEIRVVHISLKVPPDYALKYPLIYG